MAIYMHVVHSNDIHMRNHAHIHDMHMGVCPLLHIWVFYSICVYICIYSCV